MRWNSKVSNPSRVLLSCFIPVLTLLSPPLAAAQEPGPENPVVVTGRLLADRDRGPSNARLELRAAEGKYERNLRLFEGRDRPEPRVVAEPDRAGWFRLEAPPGLYELEGVAPGFATQVRTLLPLGADVELGSSMTPPGSVLEVKAVDLESGAPVAGVHIRFTPGTFGPYAELHLRQSSWTTAPASAVTDERGIVGLLVPAWQEGYLDLHAPGRLPIRLVEGPFRSSGSIRRVELPPVSTFQESTRTVRVIDDRGRPRPDLLVLRQGLVYARTDPKGMARIPTWADSGEGRAGHAQSGHGDDRHDDSRGELVGDASPKLELLGPDGSRWIVDIPPGEVLVLPDTPRIDGQVVLEGEDGQGLGGALVWTTELGHLLTADGQGRFTWPGLPTESTKLWAFLPGYRRGWTVVETAAAETEGEAAFARIALAPNLSLSGVVLDPSGDPVAGVEVQVVPASGQWVPQHSRSQQRVFADRNGRFSAHGLQPDQVYGLRAAVPGYPPILVKAEAGETVELKLEVGAVLTGTLIDDGGAPLPARIEVIHAPEDGEQPWTIDRTGRAARATLADETGRFRFVGVPVGRLAVRAESHGYVPVVLAGIEVVAEAETELEPLVMKRARPFEVRVLDAASSPVPQAQVEARRKSGVTMAEQERLRLRFPGQGRTTGLTDSHGVWRVENFGAGETLELTVSKPGFVKTHRRQSVSGETVEVRLVPGASIRGRVSTPEGEPVAGVRVEARGKVRDESGYARELSSGAVTGESGEFHLRDLAAGDQRLRVRIPRAPGSIPETGTLVSVGPGEAVTGVSLVMPTRVDLAVTVQGPGGRPAENARVSVRIATGESSSSSRVAETSADGIVRFEGLPAGPATLEAVHGDFGSRGTELELRPDMAPVILVMESKPTVQGRVVDERGEPMAGVSIRLERGRTLERDTKSAEDGTFWLPAEPDSRYLLRAETPTSPLTIKALKIGQDPIRDLELVIRDGIRVTGTVVGLSPSELASVSLRALMQTSEAMLHKWLVHGRVDAEGRFELLGLAPGRWQIRAELGGSARSATRFLELDGSRREVALDLEFEMGSLVLEGTVRHNGAPAVGATLQLLGTHSRFMTDGQGHFRIEGLKPGPYGLAIKGAWGSTTRRGELAGDDFLDVEIRSHRFSGRVIDSDGEAVEGEEVWVSNRATGKVLRRPKTDADGRFDLGRLPEGSYRLRVSHPRLGSVYRDLEHDRDHDELLLRLAAGQVATLWLEPRPAEGAFTQGARGVLLDADHRVVHSGPLSTDPTSGRLRLDRSPVGEWTFVPVGPGVASVPQAVSVPGEPFVLELQPPTRLTVRVKGAETQGSFELRDEHGRLLSPLHLGGQRIEAWPLRNGMFHIPILAPGVWTVKVLLDDGRTFEHSVQTSADKPTEVVFE